MDRRIIKVAEEAREIHAAALQRAIDETETIEGMAKGARLQSYRTYLQATVRYASPVLLRAISREEIDLDDLVQGLRPPRGWPRRTARAHTVRYALAPLLTDVPRPQAAATATGCKHVAGDCAGTLRVGTRSLGVLVVRVIDCAIEVAFSLGQCSLSSAKGVGRLTTDLSMPEAKLSGCVGRPLSRLFDHSLLRGNSWTVDFIKGRSDGAGPNVFLFATGQEPITLPWSRSRGSSDGDV